MPAGYPALPPLVSWRSALSVVGRDQPLEVHFSSFASLRSLNSFRVDVAQTLALPFAFPFFAPTATYNSVRIRSNHLRVATILRLHR